MRAALVLLRVCAGLGIACTACAESARGPLAGASEGWRSEPEPTLARARPSSAIWPDYGEALRWPAVNDAPFTSRGHEPEQQVDVRVNEVARPAYTALVADTLFPEGSLLVELPHDRAGAGSGYAMRKQDGHWSYLLLDPQGGVQASGALPLCSGCHGQAPADQVFGLPRTP